MYCITVTSGSDRGKSANLVPGVPLIIGREGAGLNLNDSEVSRIHATITANKDDTITISDEDSMNGTFVNNHPVQYAREVCVGETITIGSTSLQIQEIGGSRSVHGVQAKSPSVSHKNLTYKPANDFENVVQLEKVINIGRDPGNHIVLDHPHVSRFHARMTLKNGDCFIHDLNSINGTYVDGTKVDKYKKISDGALIQILGYVFVLEGEQLYEYDETGGKIRIEIKNLCKAVTLPSNEERVLLDNISLAVEPCEFVAVLGGSGSGKTTFLKTMMGMWPPSLGQILINGRDLYQEHSMFKSMIGYVPQDDIIHTELTVEEVLNYAALLRMPPDTLPEERSNRIDEAIEVLELEGRRHNVIKSLSGGQRKRVSIGVELLTKPSIFFLDEPTSGLDPGLEKVMMETMRKMADRGQTIFLVTHATFNIHLCDKVIFLTEGGKLAFFGTPDEALHYFSTDDFAEIYKKISLDNSPKWWQEQYWQSVYDGKYSPPEQNVNQSEQGLAEENTNVSPVRQWAILTGRYAKVLSRDMKTAMLLLFQPIIIAFFIAMLFLFSTPSFSDSDYRTSDLKVTEAVVMEGRTDIVLDRSEEESKKQRNMTTIVFVMVVSAIWLGTSNAAREVVKEIHIYKRERLVNLRITPYLFSKISVLSLVCLVQTFIFLIIIRLLLGLPYFWPTFAAFFLVSLASVMMGLTVSSIASNANNATTAVPILLIPQLILAGVLVPIEEVEPEFIHPLFNLAISKWGYELIGGGIIDINNRLAFEEPLKALDGSFTMHWWILAGFAVLFYVISALALKNKDKALF